MLELRKVNKEYRTGNLIQKALDGVSLAFREKEFVAVLGPSGSGKTTLLNIIGGLDRYDSGEMFIRGRETSSYGERDWDTYRNHTVGFIFQSYNLIPHQTLLSNVELAMTLSGVGREERRRRAQEALERVGLGEQALKKPAQLSGGQMQRVAIARALVNQPSILLADEPTGALDSETGKQVMELLREVAEDHLVIMVTHNPELAEKYATRTVRLRDGKVLEDTDPYTEEMPEEGRQKAKTAKEKVRRPSMSFFTALSLSVANLLSKKARTILVAFAASIGIAGIALILSLSTGANAYIRQMERDSLSQYPIEITSSAVSMEETMMQMMAMASEMGQETEGQIREEQMMGGMMASTQANDLKTLKRWLDSGESGMEAYTRGVDYHYGISPQIYLLTEENGEKDWRQVNPDQTFASMGLSMSENLSSLMSGYGANEVFRPLPVNPDLYEDDYTLLAGTWPQKDTDCVLVLSGTGGIPDIMLYTMGLRDAEALNSAIDGIVKGTGGGQKLEEARMYDPEEFLGISFRLLPACDTYVYDESLGIWLDMSGNRAGMLSLLEKAEEMRIVGVAQPADGVTFGILQLGIEYPASLLSRLMVTAEESPVVKAQHQSPDTDILTGRLFGETDDTGGLSFLLQNMAIHPEYLSQAVSFHWENLGMLETDETRLTAKRTVRILRELSRTGESKTLREMIQAGLPLLGEILEIDPEGMKQVITFEMDEAVMMEMYSARATRQATLKSNELKFGYADPKVPLRITIYPRDFESKQDVISLLDAYNAAMEAEGYSEKVITYTDYVGALMSSVTTIIDVITYVLIAFVAVSLVVSSIMIGIITYISVLERRKEIGILRAMGASRWNISEVFNAETILIGMLAGSIGIAVTLVLQIPINQIIRNLAGQEGIRAFLPPGAGLWLIVLCILLNLIGGAVPSRKASRQNPVEALRSE